MNKKIYIIIVFFLTSLFTAYGQKIDNDSLINNIKKDVTIFLVKKGILEKEDVKDNFGYAFIKEIFDDKVLGFNENGIYVIGVYQSHSNKHILIKEKSIYMIYDIKQINIVLKDVIDYAIRNNIGEDKMLFYLKNIIQKYDDNYNYEYTSIKKE
jgi:hypothetical protein